MNKTLFRVIINLDRLFNILTGGDLGVCFSTRCYINSKSSRGWDTVRSVVDKMMLEENHCEKSYRWERMVKLTWLRNNKL